MPRYYFHVRRGQITLPDHEVIELADTVDAEVEVAQRAQRFLERSVRRSCEHNVSAALISSMLTGCVVPKPSDYR